MNSYSYSYFDVNSILSEDTVRASTGKADDRLHIDADDVSNCS